MSCAHMTFTYHPPKPLSITPTNCTPYTPRSFLPFQIPFFPVLSSLFALSNNQDLTMLWLNLQIRWQLGCNLPYFSSTLVLCVCVCVYTYNVYIQFAYIYTYIIYIYILLNSTSNSPPALKLSYFCLTYSTFLLIPTFS